MKDKEGRKRIRGEKNVEEKKKTGRILVRWKIGLNERGGK